MNMKEWSRFNMVITLMGLMGDVYHIQMDNIPYLDAHQ